jgi:hypothetical protein
LLDQSLDAASQQENGRPAEVSQAATLAAIPQSFRIANEAPTFRRLFAESAAKAMILVQL